MKVVPSLARDWTHVKLGDIAQFRNGVNYDKNNFGNGVKIINVKDFQDHLVAPLASLGEINPEGVVREESLLKDGDIVFVRSNGNRELIGRSLFMRDVRKPVTHSAFSIRLRFNTPIVEPRFFAYLFRTDLIRHKLSSQGNGTNISNLNQAILENLIVPLPPLSDQKAITAVLSAYDDLIENNSRRIKILEEMAQALYGEWFVHFRFPGHERSRIVESEMGPIPEGWQAVPATIPIAFNPQTRLEKDGYKPFVPMGSLSETSMLIQDIETRTGNSGAKFKNGDTLFARITPCLENGKIAFVQFLPTDKDVAFGSTEFIVMRSRSLCPEFVYLLARSSEFRDNAIKSMSGATGRQRVQEAAFSHFMIAHPDEQTIQNFSTIVRPMFGSINNLAMRNQCLRQTRDLLLPKLISGEVDVAHLDITMGEMN